MHRVFTANSPSVPVGPPTSGARLNMATAWDYPHTWPQSLSHPPCHQPIYPTPYYRHNGSTSSPPGKPQPPDSNRPSGRRRASSWSTRINHRQDTINSDCSSNATRTTISPSSSFIDPTLNPSCPAELTEQQVLDITQAAVKAVLEAEAERSKERGRTAPSSASTTSFVDTAEHGPHLDTNPDDISDHLHLSRLHEYAFDRSEELERLLTEDGEPMLNPGQFVRSSTLGWPNLRLVQLNF